MYASSDKSILRQNLKRELAEFSAEEIAVKSANIVDKIKQILPQEPCGIAIYYPINQEPDILPLAKEASYNFSLPAIMGKNQRLVFRRFAEGDKLIHDKIYDKILEPQSSAQQVNPDIIIMPCLGFSHEGYRIGYGGGYYDRTLEFLRNQGKVTAIGICFAIGETDNFPIEPHDQRMDLVITENAIIKT